MSRGTKLLELMRLLRRDYEQFYNELDTPDKKLLADHIATGHVGKLRSHEGGALDHGYNPQRALERLEELISSAPRVQEDLHVYRGDSQSITQRARYPYPVPTTLDPGVAHHGFATPDEPSFASPLLKALGMSRVPRHMEEVLIPRGSPGLYMGFPGLNAPEQELLLPQRSRFRWRSDPPGDPDIEDIRRRFRVTGEYLYDPPYKARGGILRRVGRAHGYAA